MYTWEAEAEDPFAIDDDDRGGRDVMMISPPRAKGRRYVGRY